MYGEEAEDHLDVDNYKIKGLDLFKADNYSLGLTLLYTFSGTKNEEFIQFNHLPREEHDRAIYAKVHALEVPL